MSVLAWFGVLAFVVLSHRSRPKKAQVMELRQVGSTMDPRDFPASVELEAVNRVVPKSLKDLMLFSCRASLVRDGWYPECNRILL